MKIHFPGGAMEIGGSCIYVEIAGKRILLDSGIRQSGARDPLPDFRTIQEHGGLENENFKPCEPELAVCGGKAALRGIWDFPCKESFLSAGAENGRAEDGKTSFRRNGG